MRLTSFVAAFSAVVLACGAIAAANVGTGESTTRPPLSGKDPRPQSAVTDSATPAAPKATPPASRTAIPPATATKPPSQSPAARPPAPARRAVSRTAWAPYATAGPVTLHFPVDLVELVGLHESGHDGAQPQQPVRGAVRIGLMDTRGRDTHVQGAADIVVDPRREVRSPVTGTVIRAGTYTLYCDHVDHYLVVEPDARPGWEVKLLHFEGLAVGKGDRVEAGVTVVGSHARVLPFASQVDEHTVSPHWPHLHIEVVDPSVPDRPTGDRCD